MGRKWDCIHGRKNIYPKQQEAQREDPTRKSRLSRCRISRTTEDARTDQMKLLVARAKRKRQEIHIRMFQMSTKQSPASEKVRKTIPIGDPTWSLWDLQ